MPPESSAKKSEIKIEIVVYFLTFYTELKHSSMFIAFLQKYYLCDVWVCGTRLLCIKNGLIGAFVW